MVMGMSLTDFLTPRVGFRLSTAIPDRCAGVLLLCSPVAKDLVL